MVGIWGTIDPDYLKKVSDSAVAAADEAAATAKTSEIWSAVGSIRSFVWQNGQGTNHPDGFARDNELPILWARDPGTGATNALLANVPNHPDQYHMGDFSADWPGYARRKLDAQNGGTTVIGPGTLGSQEPPGKVKEYSEVIPQGEFVANEIQRTMARSTPLTSDTIASVERPLETVADNEDLILGINLFNPPEGDCIPAYDICTLPRSTEFPYMTERGDDDPLIGTNVVSTRIGDVIYSTNPGEAFAEVNFAIRDSISGARHANTIGLAGDFLGYYYIREDYTEQQFGSSNFPKYNVGPDLPQMNADIARENAAELGFDTTPQTVHAPHDTDVENRPGLQWYPDRTESADPTINIYGTATASQDELVEAPETIEWDFDDGSSATTDNNERFDHTFPGPGTYQVTATVTGSNSKTRTWSDTITINPPLRAKAAVKARNGNGARLAVAATGGSGRLVSARWACPDGRRVDGLRVICPGPKGGNARVIAVDGAGNKATARVGIRAARGKLKILAARITPTRNRRVHILRVKVRNVGNGVARGARVCVKVPKRLRRHLKAKPACKRDKFYRPGKVRISAMALRPTGRRVIRRLAVVITANARDSGGDRVFYRPGKVRIGKKT